MIKALSVLLGVLTFIGCVASFVVIRRLMRPLRQSRRARTETLSPDSWRETARTLRFRERRSLARVTRRRERVDDPRLAGLLVRRAEHLLRARDVSARYGVVRRFRLVLCVTGAECALIGGYLLTNWRLQGEPVMLAAGIFFFAYVPYVSVLILILPRLYRREGVALRRTLELNGEPVE